MTITRGAFTRGAYTIIAGAIVLGGLGACGTFLASSDDAVKPSDAGPGGSTSDIQLEGSSVLEADGGDGGVGGNDGGVVDGGGGGLCFPGAQLCETFDDSNDIDMIKTLRWTRIERKNNPGDTLVIGEEPVTGGGGGLFLRFLRSSIGSGGGRARLHKTTGMLTSASKVSMRVKFRTTTPADAEIFSVDDNDQNESTHLQDVHIRLRESGALLLRKSIGDVQLQDVPIAVQVADGNWHVIELIAATPVTVTVDNQPATIPPPLVAGWPTGTLDIVVGVLAKSEVAVPVTIDYDTVSAKLE